MPEKSKIGLSRVKKPCSRKVKMKKLSDKVRTMLAVMESQQPSSGSSSSTAVTPDGTGKVQQQEFLSTGRTGRRNALPDILNDHAVVTSSDLPVKFQKLSTKDNGNEQKDQQQPGPSSCM